jgi:hypothetical protein
MPVEEGIRFHDHTTIGAIHPLQAARGREKFSESFRQSLLHRVRQFVIIVASQINFLVKDSTAMFDRPQDIFSICGRIRPDVLSDGTTSALREALAYTRSTNWDSLRTPHLFMGLLAAPDAGVTAWADRLGANIPKLLDQFRELFYQDADPLPALLLNREFFSDNVIRLLRDAHERAADFGRDYITQFDILITLFATPNNIVAECFERIGLAASRITEVAVLAEQDDF